MKLDKVVDLSKVGAISTTISLGEGVDLESIEILIICPDLVLCYILIEILCTSVTNQLFNVIEILLHFQAYYLL